MQLGDVLKPKVSEALNQAMDQVGHIYSLCAGAGVAVPSEILAAIYQDDDAHDTCTLTACLNPLHPGPCKGWKHSLFQSAPQAWHALEAARVEKANTARLKKIEALKQAGKPIPHKLLQPIVAKPHPHAGKTANAATGEAHKAGLDVSANAGIHVNEPGKVTLGQAIKKLGTDATKQLGPKGKKPTVASKGIAAVIAQEKVTPQYKLDKAVTITPEQWNALSHDEKATIRGELAKIEKDGFGPQQKKASELLGKLPAEGKVVETKSKTAEPTPSKSEEKLTAEPKAAAPATAPHHVPKSPGEPLSAKNYTPAMADATKMAQSFVDPPKIHSLQTSFATRFKAYQKINADEWKALPEGTKTAIVHDVVGVAAADQQLHQGFIGEDGKAYTPASAWLKRRNIELPPLEQGKIDKWVPQFAKDKPVKPTPVVAIAEKTTVKGHNVFGEYTKIDKVEHPKAEPSAGPPPAEKLAVTDLSKPKTVKEAKADGTLAKVASEVAAKAIPPQVKEVSGPGAAKPLTEAEKKAKADATAKKAAQDAVAAQIAEDLAKNGGPKIVEAKEVSTPKLGDVKPAPKVGSTDQHGIYNKPHIGGEVKTTTVGLPPGYQISKDSLGYSLKHKGKLIRTSATQEALEKYAHEHHAAAGPKLADKVKQAAKEAHVAKIENKPEKPKDLPKHVQHAIDMAKGTAPGASWSKNHLAAYQELSADEFKALDTDVQSKILGELQKGKGKFLDPKKIKASDDLIAKFKGVAPPVNTPEPPKAPTLPDVKDMTPAQISSRAEAILGKDAGKLNVADLNLAAKAKEQGTAEAIEQAKGVPADVLTDPKVAAKYGDMKKAAESAAYSKIAQEALDKHLSDIHVKAVMTGKDPNGDKLSPHDLNVIAAHAEQTKSGYSFITESATKAAKEYEDAKAAFHDAVKAATVPALPKSVELSDLDKDIIGFAYRDAWGKQANKAALYGVKTYDQKALIQKHPEYGTLKNNLTDLRVLAGKVALAYAEAHAAELNVPLNEYGNKVMGPEYKLWGEKVAQRVIVSKEFDALHKQAQARLDTIRADAGLKKRALPKYDNSAVKATAAESGYHKSGAYNGPNYGKPAAAKSYMVAKVGPLLAVKHQSAAEKKLEKEISSTKVSAPEKLGGTTKTPTGTPVKLGGDASISHIPASLKKAITSDFKAMPKGKYLADPTDDIFDNLVNLAAAHGKGIDGGLSVDQVLKTIDETHSKNLGVANSGMLHKKVTDWLGTADGKAYAEAHSVPDPKKVKELTGEVTLPKGVTLEPGQKVHDLAGPGKYDPSVPASAFKAHTSAEAQKEQDAYMASQGLKWSAAQKKAMTAYTGNGPSAYDGINNYLRGEGHYNKVVKQYAVDIQSAMMPLREHTLLKRGTGWPPDIASYESHPEDLVGKTFEDKGFVSSSVAGSGGHFSGKPLQLIIEAPKGTPAAFVNGISHYKGSENEMLLAAGLKFKVISVESTTGHHTVMRVRVVGNKTNEGAAGGVTAAAFG